MEKNDIGLTQERVKFFILNSLSPENENSRIRWARQPAWTRESLIERNAVLWGAAKTTNPNVPVFAIVSAEFDRLVETGQIAVNDAGELSLGTPLFEHAQPVSETAVKIVKHICDTAILQRSNENISEDVHEEILNSLAVIVDQQLLEHNSLRVFTLLNESVSVLGQELAAAIVADINNRRGLFVPLDEDKDGNQSVPLSFQRVVEEALDFAEILKKEYQPSAADVADLLKLREQAVDARSTVNSMTFTAVQIGDEKIAEELADIDRRLRKIGRRYTDMMPEAEVEGVEEAKVARRLRSHALGGFCETFRVKVSDIDTGSQPGAYKTATLIPREGARELFFRLHSRDVDKAHKEFDALKLDEGDEFIIQIKRLSKERA